MGFSISRIFGKASQRSQPGDTVEAILDTVEAEPFGLSDNNVLYAGLNELGGYYMFQSVIVGSLKIKVKNGASLWIKAEELNLELQSDMEELQSDPTDVKGRWITKIDFEIEESDIDLLKKASKAKIQISTQNQTVVFTTLDTTQSK